MSLRSRLEKQGYTLVNKQRWQRITNLQRQVESARNREWEQQNTIDDLYERIAELEAEVEAHKRIEARLAERAIVVSGYPEQGDTEIHTANQTLPPDSRGDDGEET